MLTVAACSGGGSEPTPSASATASRTPEPTAVDVAAELAELEAEFAAHLGVYAVDTGTGRVVEHRADERFAYASTFKALAAAAVLAATPADGLDEVVVYAAADVVEWSPVTEPHAGTGLPLRDLLAAAVEQSDNTAGNLLLQRLGGPEGLAEALRGLGDEVTRPARTEPDLNRWAPGETRDTTTPRALGTDLAAYVLGDALDADDQELLTGWLTASQTGLGLVRAGVPAGWVVADKSGSADHGTRNDVAVVWPPDDAPIVLAIMSWRTDPAAAPDDALLARAAEVVVASLG